MVHELGEWSMSWENCPFLQVERSGPKFMGRLFKLEGGFKL